jgi:hypothetical protein
LTDEPQRQSIPSARFSRDEYTPPVPASAPAKPSRIHEYSWVRGFNYQPSWGSHGITIWNDFREATFAKEVELGLKHFPKLNTLRIWFSYDAHVADPKKFLAAAKRASELLAERKVKIIPVIFNGWHSEVEFGGFSRGQLYSSSRHVPAFGPHRQYLCELIEAIRPAGNLLMYDISNEPFNNGGKEKGSIELKFLEAMARQIRDLDSKTPISVGTQGCPGIGGPEDLDLIDSFVDVHAVHPYWIPIIPADGFPAWLTGWYGVRIEAAEYDAQRRVATIRMTRGGKDSWIELGLEREPSKITLDGRNMPETARERRGQILVLRTDTGTTLQIHFP